ncbi:MAG TPA: NBR1-Ig-like domain-containing protein [Anaerolineae bacterium]
MQSLPRRFLIPVVVIVALLILGAAAVLIAQPGASPACGAHTVVANQPLILDDGVTVAIAPDAVELRFNRAVLAEADLALEANAQVLAAISALPVNLRMQGSALVFSRCGDTAIPVHLESPAPDPSLDAYGWDGERWAWLGGSSDRLIADLPDLPQIVAWVRALPAAPTIGAEPDPHTAGLAPEYAGIVTEVYAPGLQVAANGSVTGPVPAAPDEDAPYVVYPVVGNVKSDGQIDADSVQTLLKDEAARKKHVETLSSIAAGSNFAGIVIDYRNLKLEADTSGAFVSLIEELAAALHVQGKSLVVRLPAPDAAGTTSYDWVRVGRAADVVQLELPIEPGFYQPDGIVADVMRWPLTWVDRNKLQPVISAASARDALWGTPLSFSEAAAAFVDVTPSTISATVGTSLTLSLGSTVHVDFDPDTGAYATGPMDGQTYIHTAATLAYKLNALSGLRLRGVVIRDVQGQDAAPNLLEPIRAYRQQTQVIGKSEVNVEWSIAAQGESNVLKQTRPLTNADLVWTPDRDGTFTVEAAIESVSQDVATVTVGKSEPEEPAGPCAGATYVADVTVPDNTHFDKGKDFTKTWKVRNNGTCAWSADTELAFVSGSQLGGRSPVKVGALDVGDTLDISVPMKSGDKDGSFTGIWQLRNADGAFGDQLTIVVKVGEEIAAPPPVAPPAGGGPTQYGIQAHFYGYVDTAAGAQGIVGYTSEMGLGWVKIQFRWGEYDYYCGGPDLGVLDTMINTANAAGQKVMLSIVTSPPCTHPWTGDLHAPPDDPAALAELVGGLSDLFRGRIHAIEVWNEPNIVTEWVTSPQAIDAKRYTQMLAAAYNAIKAQDPNILVISAGLAPTGVNNGVHAVDDFEYLRQMVAAGATKYMDCVGTHVNALRMPPSAKLGGEYDSLFTPPHHSWYFYDTVQGYQSITGKPACLTEFGVASSETIGQVAGFEWAGENSQQEQADWVTEGMTLCKQWGCRLVILFNLDYGPATRIVDSPSLYSFIDMGLGRRPVFQAVQNWCAANGCK